MGKTIGIGVPWQDAENNWSYYDLVLGLFMPPHWHNWKYDAREYIYPPYYPTVWKMAQDVHSERAAQASQYGIRTWDLGTEPNNKEQSNTTGKDSAKFSQWWRANAKGSVRLPGLLVMEPDSLDAVGWMEEYLDAGGVIPDFWSLDNYAWVPDQWDNNLHPIRELFAKRGVERPVIIKECASYGDVPSQIVMMDHIHKRLNDGTIYEAYWYSSWDPFGPFRNADLLNREATAVTKVGAHYMSLKNIQPAPDLDTQIHIPVILG